MQGKALARPVVALSTSRSAAYRQRIQKALAFVADNLDRPIRTADIARAAAFSEYHFHRVFLALTGERVGQFVTRYRLESAARMLAYETDNSVVEVALRCGYSSSSNFSKAFSAYFGVSPSTLRRPGGSPPPGGLPQLPEDGSRPGRAPSILQQRYGKELAVGELFASAQRAPAAVMLDSVGRRLRFEERGETPLVCLSGPGAYDVAAGVALWQRFAPTLVQLGLWQPAGELFGIVHDDPVITAEALCRYDACVAVQTPLKSPPPPLFASHLPAGRFAVFRYRGPVAELDVLYRDIYAVWFPQSSLAPDSFPPVERYLSRGPDADGAVDLELLFKVRPLRA